MKVGILLPAALDLGLLRRARQLSLLIGDIEDADGTSWSAVIGLPHESEKQWREIERELRAANTRTVVRHLKWEPVLVENARRMFANLPATLDLEGIDEVVVPRDWGWNFQDCDAVIAFADPGLGAVLPLAPTVFYCPDLAVRIVPEAAARSIDDPYWQRQTDAFRIWRQSSVVTSDVSTIDDLVSYAGVRRERLELVPNLLDHDEEMPAAVGGRSATLAWLIGPASLHDLENAVKALETYSSEGGRLDPVVVHDGLSSADATDFYSEGLPTRVADSLYGLPSKVLSSDRELFRYLGQAAALWSSRLAGGEGEAPLLAAQAGIPFVGADYQANRAAADGSAVLYPLNDPLAMADALHAVEAMVVAGKGAKGSRKRASPGDKREAIRKLVLRLRETAVAD